MEKKTIGAFIAALRKANGMTQQELADKLDISNKAVSRWERDECAPDIMLIPALAEILGVTCDELLKGERITSEFRGERSEPKIERQVKALVHRTLSKFVMLIWISLALSAAGLICMFAISYGAFRPVIGIAALCAFAVAAFVLTAIATSKLKETKRDNELFEAADEELIQRLNQSLGNLSYLSFTFAIASVIISVPLIPFWADAVNAVTSFGTYLTFFIVLAPAYGLLCLALKSFYVAFITEQPRKKPVRIRNKKLIAMNAVQLSSTAVLCILFIVGSYYIFTVGGLTLIGFGLYIFPAVSVLILAILLAAARKEDRKALVPSGIRNALMFIPALMLVSAHSVEDYGHYDSWNANLLLCALGVTMLIFLVYLLVKPIIFKSK